MKWYKHISDSLDDPFIFDLMTKHGADGYMIFFGILEVYAREFQPKDSWNLSVSLSYLKQKFHKTHKQLITNPLQTISNSGKWDIKIDGDRVDIFIPKFKELMDESTLKKLRENGKSFRNESGIIPPKFLTDKDVDKDAEEEKEKKKKFSPPSIQEITDYCTERDNGVDSVRFFNFYAAKNWMIGKNKMQDWKAAVITWERRDKTGERKEACEL